MRVMQSLLFTVPLCGCVPNRSPTSSSRVLGTLITWSNTPPRPSPISSAVVTAVAAWSSARHTHTPWGWPLRLPCRHILSSPPPLPWSCSGCTRTPSHQCPCSAQHTPTWRTLYTGMGLSSWSSGPRRGKVWKTETKEMWNKRFGRETLRWRLVISITYICCVTFYLFLFFKCSSIHSCMWHMIFLLSSVEFRWLHLIYTIW